MTYFNVGHAAPRVKILFLLCFHRIVKNFYPSGTSFHAGFRRFARYSQDAGGGQVTELSTGFSTRTFCAESPCLRHDRTGVVFELLRRRLDTGFQLVHKNRAVQSRLYGWQKLHGDDAGIFFSDAAATPEKP